MEFFTSTIATLTTVVTALEAGGQYGAL